MKVKELMTANVIGIAPEESIRVAARTMEHYNIGAMPVCRSDGSICGMLTDRDLALRCLTGEGNQKTVQQVMTRRVLYVSPETDAKTAADVMARNQVRRLPVVENGCICGMLSLGDLAAGEETGAQAGEALAEISRGLSKR